MKGRGGDGQLDMVEEIFCLEVFIVESFIYVPNCFNLPPGLCKFISSQEGYKYIEGSRLTVGVFL